MADLVSLEFDGKTLGLTPSSLSKTTIARFFNVHEEGLHLKVVHNGKTDNIWPLSNGKFLVPLGTTNADVIAFNASEDSEDFVQGAFDFRAPSLPHVTTNYGMAHCMTSRPSKLQGSGFGKRPAPGLSFIKTKKKKASALVKDFIFSAVDEERQMVQLFPISINLTELSEKFGCLSVPIICSSIEQELREQGEVVRLVITDARGQPIMDSSQTRNESFWASQRTFRAMSQQTFKRWKPGVWAALNTGLCTLEEEEEDERGQAIQIQKGIPSSSLEEQHLVSHASARDDSCLEKMMKTMEEIKDSMEARKEFKKLKELFQCVICQSTCAASMYLCITGCGQLIGCFLCVSKIEDCPLCRLSLPDVQIRKPMFVSGLATLLDIPEISMRSALKEANLLSSPPNEADDDIDDNEL